MSDSKNDSQSHRKHNRSSVPKDHYYFILLRTFYQMNYKATYS